MAIRLPELARVCFLAIVCGKITTTNPKIKKWLKTKRMMVSRVKIGGRAFVFRAITGDSFGGHFHMDLAAIDFFGKKDSPKQTHTLKQIQDEIEILVGQKCEADYAGKFEVPLADLPEIVQNYLQVAITPTVVGGVRIRTTGGTLLVEGAPVQSIRWRIRKDKKRVGIELEGARSVEISEEYFENIWRPIESTFTKLIQRGPQSAHSEK